MEFVRAGVDIDGSFRNLVPVLDLLVGLGNKPVTDGFIESQGGFYCAMSEPIDFAAVGAAFDFDERIVRNPERDLIFDPTTWVSLEGPSSPELA